LREGETRFLFQPRRGGLSVLDEVLSKSGAGPAKRTRLAGGGLHTDRPHGGDS
jgi:hypothetical protein